MTNEAFPLPHGVPDRPSAARMYDYFLGGHHNFEIDRVAGDKVIEANPDTPAVAQANRAFLRRSVKYLLSQGVNQFVDLGSGIPTVGNVHEVTQKAHSNAHVLYVDTDPVAVQHSQAMLQGHSLAGIIQADIRQPEDILNHPDAQRLLDLSQPVAVLIVAVLHFIVDDGEVHRLLQVIRNALVPGSFIVISHVTTEGLPAEIIARGQQLYAQSTNPVKPRSRAEIEAFFTGLGLVEPGLVFTPLWRPDGTNDVFLSEPTRSRVLAGVGRIL